MPYSNKIGICSDHAGYEVKEHIKAQLVARGLQVEDFGCPSTERCDYPDYAHPMGRPRARHLGLRIGQRHLYGDE